MHGPPISTRIALPLFVVALFLLSSTASPVSAAMVVSPATVTLDGPETSQQLLVTAIQPDGQRKDRTRMASYKSANAGVAVVDGDGLVQPHAEGRTEIVVRSGEETVRVPIAVTGLVAPRPILFEQQLVPILTKAGCNSGGCHGKAEGQNGFKLSVFGSNPSADYDALVKEGRGRRVFPSAPDQSLVLQKATAEVPHGGGLRIEPDGLGHRRLRRWLVEGAKFTGGDAPPIASVEVEPAEQVLLAGESQQLRVTAIDAAGARRCVTIEAGYESNAATIADVDRRGLVAAGELAGEAAILVRFQEHVAVSRITIPRPGVSVARPPEANFVDKLAWDKLQRLGIMPSEPADDATFMRRVYLDVIGTLPTADEVRAFLADATTDKRATLVDRVLSREEYADYWAMRWSDLLRVDRDRVTPPVAVATSRWLRRQFAENRPYDQFVRDIVTVQGNTAAEGPAGFYRVLDTPEALARSISQLFLGVRIECAQCHHHPAEKWGQDDYFALAGFFTGVVRKNLPTGRMAIVSRGGADLAHPRTGQLVPARALGAPPARFAPGGDRRLNLAEWMTAPDNPFLATAISNRLWAHYLGRGLVEPIDDLRATNPATNEPLLAVLASHMRDVKFDLKAFTRTLLNSRAYQLSSRANESNAGDEQNFSHAAHKALPAEVLLDAICRVTGVPEKFNGWPEGYRAIQIWDNRMPSYFFRIFGRPVRASVCECERSNEPSVTQALHLMNSPEITAKLHDRQGRLRQLALASLGPKETIDELCLSALARFPSDAERAVLLQAFAGADGDCLTALEDVLWTLVNSKEFLYNH
ncbi:MAG TPA: DUF1549 domain-containing protein [Pirellulales bacterium]|nr:DUF1549 domain-containing protein [Pirellulales bacterium]